MEIVFLRNLYDSENFSKIKRSHLRRGLYIVQNAQNE